MGFEESLFEEAANELGQQGLTLIGNETRISMHCSHLIECKVSTIPQCTVLI